MGSIVYHFSSHKVGDYDCLLHSGGNCLLEDLYSLKATQNPDWRPSNPRSTTGSSKWRLIKLLEASKVSSWNIFLCIVFLICYLPCYILSFLFLARLLSPTSFYEARLYVMTLFFLNSSLDPVIYCWKMGPIRRTLMDIMRGIVKLVQRITVRFWYQFTMHELRASAMVMLNLICKKYQRKIDGWRALTVKKIEHWSSIESGVRKYQLLVSSAFCMRNL